MGKKILFSGIGAAVVIIAAVSFLLYPPQQPILSGPSAVIFATRSGDVPIQVEIADSEAEREQGLMERTSLGENDGMLFIFENEGQFSFWMKNTLIPLDIIFIDKNHKVLNIQHAVPCENDPCALYPSGGLALFVVEVNGGLAAEKGIQTGDQVRFTGL